MPLLKTPAGDIHRVADDLVDYYHQQGWTDEPEPEFPPAPPQDNQDNQDPLSDPAVLDAALRVAGLKTTGTAEAKRARLAEHNNPKE